MAGWKKGREGGGEGGREEGREEEWREECIDRWVGACMDGRMRMDEKAIS